MNPRSRSTDVLVQEVGLETLVYDRRHDTVHSLDALTAHVYHKADGTLTVADLASSARASVNPAADRQLVSLALAELERVRLLDDPGADRTDATGKVVSRRDAVRYLGAVAGMPMIASLSSPGFGGGVSEDGGGHSFSRSGGKSVSKSRSGGRSRSRSENRSRSRSRSWP